MIHLLVAYRRSTQTLIECTEFEADRLGDAIQARIQMEDAHWGDPDVEIVILMGESERSIRQTHGRYFLTMGDLTERIQTTMGTGRLRQRRQGLAIPA